MAKFSEYLKDLRKSGRLSFTVDEAASDLKVSKYNAFIIKALQCVDTTQKEVSIKSIKRLFALLSSSMKR